MMTRARRPRWIVGGSGARTPHSSLRRSVRSAICGALILAACGSSATTGATTTVASTLASPATTSTTAVPQSSTAVSLPPVLTTSVSAPSTAPRPISTTAPSVAEFTPLMPLPPSGGGPPLKVTWTRSTVPAGPYNGRVRTDGFGLTSINSSTPSVIWVSDDGIEWRKQTLPDGFEAADASRSRDFIAAIGRTIRAGIRVPALAIFHTDGTSVLTVLDTGGRGPAQKPVRAQVAVSGTRIIAVVNAGPETGGDTDVSLVFIGESGPPFSRQVNTRFKDAKLSSGSQYFWWISTEDAGTGPVSTIFAPADPIGNIDYTSLDAGWQPRAHLAGNVTHIGGRDAGEEYFAIDDGASPGSVRSIITPPSLILDDAIAARAFNGMTWLRQCCLNAEPSIGIGKAGIFALVSTEKGRRTPTPDLSKLAIAVSRDRTDWTIEPIGQLLPERGLDVTHLIGLGTRFLVVVTDRYPEPNGTRDAIVLVGEAT